MSELPYRVTVEGEGTRIEREIGQEQLLRVLAVILGGAGAPLHHPVGGGVAAEAGSAGTSTPAASPARSRPTDLTVGEFLNGCNAAGNAERIAGIAMYLEEQLGEGSVSKDVLPTWFRKAGYAIPKNLSRDISTAVKKNLIAEEHDQAGQYFVTVTGKQHLRSRSGEA